MTGTLTNEQWLQLVNIPDKAFQRALRRPEFSWVNQKGQREVLVDWIFPWAYSDSSGNVRRFGRTAVAIRTAWPDHILFNRDNYLPTARQIRYKKK